MGRTRKTAVKMAHELANQAATSSGAVASRRSQAERTQAMRSALICAGRRLFVLQGFAATGTPQLVAEAGATRGALYHHFEDKSDLLMAVAEQMADEVAAHIVERARAGTGPAGQLASGAQAYFDSMAQQGRARILLVEAPAALKPVQLRELSRRAGEQALRKGVEDLCRARGLNSKAPVTELASMLSAAFDRAALEIAQGASTKPYVKAVEMMIGWLAIGRG